MLEMRRILCPVDFSDASRHALEHAAVIAKWYDAQVTALHVAPPVYLVEGPLLFTDLPAASMPTEADREARKEELRRWVEPLDTVGLPTEIRIEDGHNAAARILAEAGSLPADLIVMGTHGRTGFERLVLGSVTEKVLRKAACPVLTVPPPAIRAAKPPFKRLLCPVDFSRPSIAALRFALSLAQESDARLTALHVLAEPGAGEPFEPFDTPEYRLRCEEDARQQLDALISTEARAYCEPITSLVWGKPYKKILEAAEREEADAIVMGVHGHNVVELMLFGSTTNQIVRHASCAVVTLRG
jgi:nucleotide-binding universal stress UspA family protein